MDKKVITKVNFLLTAENIIPYDLLLALGEQNLVPEKIRNDRIARVLKRDRKDTPEGYLRNAVEDLSKLNFNNKEQVLSLLRSQLGSNLSGFGQTASPAPVAPAATTTPAAPPLSSLPPPLSPDVVDEGSSWWGMIGVIFLLAIPVLLIFRKQVEEIVIPGPKKSRKKKN